MLGVRSFKKSFFASFCKKDIPMTGNNDPPTCWRQAELQGGLGEGVDGCIHCIVYNVCSVHL